MTFDSLLSHIGRMPFALSFEGGTRVPPPTTSHSRCEVAERAGSARPVQAAS